MSEEQKPDSGTECFRYLLNSMTEGERAAFERRLSREPVLVATLKSCSEGVTEFARVSSVTEASPVSGMQGVIWQDVVKSLNHEEEAGGALALSHRAWWRWGWPAAAAFLLGLNVWHQRGGTAFGPPDRSVTVAAPAVVGDAGSVAEKAQRAERSAAGSDGVSSPPVRRSPPDVDHPQVGARPGEIVDTPPTGSRIVAMELVDPASFARGDRNGLLDQAKAILSSPGLVAVSPALGDAPSAAGGVVSDGAATSEGVVTLGNLNSVSGSVESLTLFGAPLTQGATTPLTLTLNTDGVAPGSTTSATLSNSGLPTAAEPSPYAWNVYDDSAHQGYLNLYNLPSVAAGSSLELWVKPAGSDQFVAVGQVPAQFYGKSGSVYYQLPAATATPSELLITRETTPSPAAPSANAVLRGP